MGLLSDNVAHLRLSGCKSWISPGIDSLRCSCFVDSFSANYLLLKVTSSCQIQENSSPKKCFTLYSGSIQVLSPGINLKYLYFTRVVYFHKTLRSLLQTNIVPFTTPFVRHIGYYFYLQTYSSSIQQL